MEIANTLHVNPAYYSLYESGKLLPDLNKIVNIERLFDLPIEYPQYDISSEQKTAFLEAFTILCQKYPVSAVLSYCQKQFRRNTSAPAIIVAFTKRVCSPSDVSVNTVLTEKW